MPNILVFVEQHAGKPARAALECIGAARACGGNVCAVVAGEGADAAAGALGRFGAARVVVLQGGESSSDALAADLAAIAREQGARAFFCGATSSGRDLAPRVAALLDSTLLSDCTALAAQGESFSAVRPAASVA